ncbi:MAG: HNH endonuclease, partial [Actinomycetia bacterium]|nr:HNH endonuclease [Actinomycetes bacterium]
AQRTALWARDRGCRFPGCTAPWTHAHHINPWQHGGTTDLANGLLLCGHHHRAIHDGTWTIITGPDGANTTITFTHPTRLTSHHSPIPPPDPLTIE